MNKNKCGKICQRKLYWQFHLLTAINVNKIKKNINRHHEIIRNIYDGKNKTKFIARIINDNMTGTDQQHTLMYIQVHIR